MVPTLRFPENVLVNNGFINGYIKDAERDIEYKDSIYLLFQPKNLDQFRDFLENEYERTKQIIEDYDLDKGFVVVIYKLDPIYKVDFDLIRDSKYSKTSITFQNMFPKVIKLKKSDYVREEVSLQYRIFNRTQDLINYWEERIGMPLEKNQEAWPGYSEEAETLNFNKIKEIIEI